MRFGHFHRAFFNDRKVVEKVTRVDAEKLFAKRINTAHDAVLRFGFNDFRFYAVFAYAGKIVYKVVYRLKDVFIRVFKANVGAIFFR